MRNTISIFLAIAMLITNMRVTFATHYCSGEVVNSGVVVGQGSIDCGMEKVDDRCDSQSQRPLIKSNCCQNELIQLSIQDSYNNPPIEKSNLSPVFLTAFVVTLLEVEFFENFPKAEYLNYIPPLLKLDIPILIQAFLI